MKKNIVLIIMLLIIAFKANSQLVVYSSWGANQLAHDLMLTAGTVSNAQYTGAPNSIGYFQGNASNLGINFGVVMTSGSIFDIPQPVSGLASIDNALPGDADLDSLCSNSSYDAAVLTFDFVPFTDTIKFQYVFGSEEYPEYVGSAYNDVFGFFITGAKPSGGTYNSENIALVPGTNVPVSINSVNADSNAAFYIANDTLNGQQIVFDGFTLALKAQVLVVHSTTYHFKFAVADVGDHIMDSGIFLKAQSDSTAGISGSQLPESEINIFPNPAHNKIEIKSEKLKVEGVWIYNIQDQQMMSTTFLNQNSVEIDVSMLPKGIYIVKINCEAGLVNRKLVIQ
jgi:hypothetical protein